MRRIGVSRAKRTLGTLLDLIEKGEDIVITRRGRPVARLVPVVMRCDRAQAAVAAIRAARRGVTLGGIPLKALIEEGRS